MYQRKNYSSEYKPKEASWCDFRCRASASLPWILGDQPEHASTEVPVVDAGSRKGVYKYW